MKKDRLVTTYDGKDALASQCRYIKGDYYKKNEHCFFIEGKWYRINSGYLDKDYETGIWYFKSDPIFHNLERGVVSFKAAEPVYGYFTPNMITNVNVYIEGSITLALNEYILRENGFTEINNCGVYVDINDPRYSPELNERIMKNLLRQIKERSDYRIDSTLEDHIKIYDEYKKYNHHVSINENFSHFLPYSFGVEFETSDGVLPLRYCAKLGLVPLRDGSINGLEYTTVPLRGLEGLGTLVSIAQELTKYTQIGMDCSLHIHLGGYPKSITSIVALFNLLLMIQDDMYHLFPAWTRNPVSIGKRHNYTAPLDKIYPVALKKSDPNSNLLVESRFNQLYYYFSGGHTFYSLTDDEHPNDPSNTRKWNVNSRYHYFNLVPLIFGKRRTVESRLHTATTNPIKVVNWLFINSAILKYAEMHMKELAVADVQIERVRLQNIMNEVYPAPMATVLNSYMKYREDYFLQLSRKELTCSDEIKNDSKISLEQYNVLNIKL